MARRSKQQVSDDCLLHDDSLPVVNEASARSVLLSDGDLARSPPVVQATTSTSESTSFEELAAQLSEIVDRLEEGDIPLNEAVALFEKGMDIAKRSHALLDRAEQRIEELLRVEEDGSAVTRPFE